MGCLKQLLRLSCILSHMAVLAHISVSYTHLDVYKRQELTYGYQGRNLVSFTDANGGRYKIQYEDGYTVTTDAEGNVVTYYYDEWKRTTRIVDALGLSLIHIFTVWKMKKWKQIWLKRYGP